MASVPKSQVNLTNIQEAGMGSRLPVNAVSYYYYKPILAYYRLLLLLLLLSLISSCNPLIDNKPSNTYSNHFVYLSLIDDALDNGS